MKPVIEGQGLVRHYRRGTTAVRALDGVSIQAAGGEFVVVTGPSGSGKSTLLHLLGGLDVPTAGRVVVDGTDLGTLDDGELTAFRRRRLGFVFQFFNLLPTLSAWENVALPGLLDGHPMGRLRPRATELLARVGLAARAEHRPAELSGGELQRVAIARALMARPVLILADEPTGNLDRESGAGVLDLLRACCTEEGAAVVLATHDPEAAGAGDRLVRLVDGRVEPPGSAISPGLAHQWLR
jgi:putative ABC transport system ATP-binding protein